METVNNAKTRYQKLSKSGKKEVLAAIELLTALYSHLEMKTQLEALI